MGQKRPPARKPNSVAKRRSSGSGRVTPRAPRKEVTPAQMRQMATKELLRRAALATPMIGGLSILGLLALSVAKGPDRPDAVVGSTSTATPGAVVEEQADEVAAGGDTVTADEPGGSAQRGPSDSDSESVGSDGDGGRSGPGGGDEISTGDERRHPEAVADPSSDHHRPRHDQPGSSDDEDRRGEPPGGDTIELAGGLPFSGNDHHGGNDHHDGDVSVNAGPVNVSVNTTAGGPSAAGNGSSSHHNSSTSRNDRPSTHRPSHSDHSGHDGVSVGARTPPVVLPLPGAGPVPGPDTEIHPVPSRRPGAPQTPTETPDDAFGRGGLGGGNSIVDRLGDAIDDDKPPEDEAPAPAPEEEPPPAQRGGGSLVERLGRSISERPPTDDEATPPEADPPAEEPAPEQQANDDDEAPEPEAPEVPEHETPTPGPGVRVPQVAEKPPVEEVPEPEAPADEVVEEIPVDNWRQVAEPEPAPEDVVEDEDEETVATPEVEVVEASGFRAAGQPGVDPADLPIEETDLPVETSSS